MSKKIKKALEWLGHYDDMALKPPTHESRSEQIQRITHQKELMIGFIKDETNKTPRWTKNGYKLR